jgi:uncharacterized protein
VARLVEEPLRTDCTSALKALGFVHVAVDLQGFRSGALNEALPLSVRRSTATPVLEEGRRS